MCKNTESLIFKVTNVMFPLTFLLARLCMGIPFSCIWGQKLWAFLQSNPPAILAAKSYVLYGAVSYVLAHAIHKLRIALIQNFALNGLNIYWFGTMIKVFCLLFDTTRQLFC